MSSCRTGLRGDWCRVRDSNSHAFRGFSLASCYVYQFHQRGSHLYLVNGAGKTGGGSQKTLTRPQAAGTAAAAAPVRGADRGGADTPPGGAEGGGCCAGARSQGRPGLPARGDRARGNRARYWRRHRRDGCALPQGRSRGSRAGVPSPVGQRGFETGTRTREGAARAAARTIARGRASSDAPSSAARSAISSRLALAVRSRSRTGSRGCMVGRVPQLTGRGAAANLLRSSRFSTGQGGQDFLTRSGRPPATGCGAPKPQGFRAG